MAAEPQTGRNSAYRGLTVGYMQVLDGTENWCTEAPVLFKSQLCVVCVFSIYEYLFKSIS